MSRPLRIEYPGAYYHVMNRGRGRQTIFEDQADYERFMAPMQKIGAAWGGLKYSCDPQYGECGQGVNEDESFPP